MRGLFASRVFIDVTRPDYSGKSDPNIAHVRVQSDDRPSRSNIDRAFPFKFIDVDEISMSLYLRNLNDLYLMHPNGTDEFRLRVVMGGFSWFGIFKALDAMLKTAPSARSEEVERACLAGIVELGELVARVPCQQVRSMNSHRRIRSPGISAFVRFDRKAIRALELKGRRWGREGE